MNTRFVAIGTAVLSVALGAAGTAVAGPSPNPTPTPVNLPSLPPDQHLDPYAKIGIDLLTGAIRQGITNAQNSTAGQVSYFKRFDMQVQTGRNGYRSIRLHQGTVINPRGQSITVGQQVDVSGVSQADGTIDANVITIKQ
ncbi:MAG: hypothetical protein NVS4B5_10480 [Vulcanimicrobiaceae bacterium]